MIRVHSCGIEDELGISYIPCCEVVRNSPARLLLIDLEPLKVTRSLMLSFMLLGLVVVVEGSATTISLCMALNRVECR